MVAEWVEMLDVKLVEEKGVLRVATMGVMWVQKLVEPKAGSMGDWKGMRSDQRSVVLTALL